MECNYDELVSVSKNVNVPIEPCTSCQICDSFIPIISARDAYPRICDECKKRLKRLIYGPPKEEDHVNPG